MFKTRFLVSFAIIALMLGEVSMRPLISVSAQGQTFVYPAALIDGRSAGNLILGQTVVEQAVKMFPSAPPGYEGNPRPPRGFPEAKIGQVSPKPTLVYNPWMTLYLLFFDANQKLVIVVDGGKSRFRGLSQQEMLRQYPQLKETSRGSLEYEMQVEVQPCVTLMLLISSRDNTVGDIAYAFTCPTQSLAQPSQIAQAGETILFRPSSGKRLERVAWLDKDTIAATLVDGSNNREIALIDVPSGSVKRLAYGGCPSLSPDRTKIAFVSGPGSRGNVSITDLRTLESRTLRTDLAAGCSTWSPDGRYIAAEVKSQAGGEGLVILAADTGRTEHTISPAPGFSLSDPAWSPDSRRLAFVSTKVEIKIQPFEIRYLATQVETFDLARGSQTKLMEGPPGNRLSELIFLQDGTGILFVLGGVIYKYREGPAERLFPGRWPAWHPDPGMLSFVRGSGIYGGSALYTVRL